MKTPITQMRLSEITRQELEEIRRAYGRSDWTDAVRMMIMWFSSNRPTIEITPGPPQKKIPKKSRQPA